MKRAVFVLAVLAASARGDRMAPAPIPERVARTDLTTLARVKRVEEKAAELPVAPGAGLKQPFRVAVLEVKEKVAGAGSPKFVKVAFIPPSGRRGFGSFDFKPGSEALFFLTKAHGSEYYRVMMYFDAEAPGEAQIKAAREAGKLLASPRKGLESKNQAERALTAALLITRYRSQPFADPAKIKQAPISPAESRLILEGLAAGDWKAPAYNQFSPRSLFLRLGLTEKDGWKVKNFATLNEEAQAWLKANAGKYVIKRFTTGVGVEP